MTANHEQPCIENALVNCDWLRQNLYNPDQVILDATFFLPRQQRDALGEFQRRHIPDAQFFDIDEIADLTSPLPHTLPSAEQFSKQVGELGIGNDTRIIVYDNNHFFASARAWWMFRVFGHAEVKVLDGGLAAWLNRSLPTTCDLPAPAGKVFQAVFHPELYVDLKQMRMFRQLGNRQILDARSADSFLGHRPPTEAGPPSGHIPGSINIPYKNLIAEDASTLLPAEQLRKAMSRAGVDFSRPMVASCGSGVSAALLLLALDRIGKHDIPMYDGSWAEWSRQ